MADTPKIPTITEYFNKIVETDPLKRLEYIIKNEQETLFRGIYTYSQASGDSYPREPFFASIKIAPFKNYEAPCAIEGVLVLDDITQKWKFDTECLAIMGLYFPNLQMMVEYDVLVAPTKQELSYYWRNAGNEISHKDSFNTLQERRDNNGEDIDHKAVSDKDFMDGQTINIAVSENQSGLSVPKISLTELSAGHYAYVIEDFSAENKMVLNVMYDRLKDTLSQDEKNTLSGIIGL